MLNCDRRSQSAPNRPGIYSDSYRMPFGMIRRERTDHREREISRKEIRVQQYIVNLTDHLIGKYRYYDYLVCATPPWDWIRFSERIKNDLETDEVRKMNPETLGRIMCSLEIGDVLIGKAELLHGLHFCGDCGDLLREMVSVCLARIIRDRLDPASDGLSSIPPYAPPYKRGVSR
jgi:hypothetical protein